MINKKNEFDEVTIIQQKCLNCNSMKLIFLGFDELKINNKNLIKIFILCANCNMRQSINIEGVLLKPQKEQMK
ncbi:hypothetical protein GOV12_02295 [Candidatus Pacearchaeota archaeon]|nr:hypothetical protein [Candidatus Pacearchaeota archaeon]